MPSAVTESTIPMTNSGLIGKSTSGVGDSTRMDVNTVLSLLSVYTVSQVDSALSLKAGITGSTGSLVMPSGTTAQRDGSPSIGYERWNTTTGRREIWNGTAWENNVRLSGDTMSGTLGTPSVVGLGGVSSLILDNAGTGGIFLCFVAANRAWVGNGGLGVYMACYPMNDNLYDLGLTGGTQRYWRTLYVNSITCVGAVISGAITASGTVSTRNETSPTKTEIYNTYTDATTYERAVIDWVTTTNTCRVGTEKGSVGGSARDLCFVTDATVRLTINGTTGVTTFTESIISTKTIRLAAEITGTPSGTTQTIDLSNGNHQTLSLVSATGTVTATLTVPTTSSAGTIVVKQHASAAKGITWAVSSGTIKWMGTQPTWGSDAVSAVRIVAWRWDGSVMYLSATEVGT